MRLERVDCSLGVVLRLDIGGEIVKITGPLKTILPGLPGVPLPTIEDGIPSLSQMAGDVNDSPLTPEQILSNISTADLVKELARRENVERHHMAHSDYSIHITADSVAIISRDGRHEGFIGAD